MMFLAMFGMVLGAAIDAAEVDALRAAWRQSGDAAALQSLLDARRDLISAERGDPRARQWLLDQATDTFFGMWANTDSIAEATLGFRSDSAQEELAALIADVRSLLAPCDGMPETDYLRGVLAGMDAAIGNAESAESCETRLAAIQPDLQGIAASRSLRARLHAAVARGDEAAADRHASALIAMSKADAEDLLAAALHRMSSAPATAAMAIWSETDRMLSRSGRGDLRPVLADGYASVHAGDTSLSAWTALAARLLEEGGHPSGVDAFVLKRMQRLAPADDPAMVAIKARIEERRREALAAHAATEAAEDAAEQHAEHATLIAAIETYRQGQVVDALDLDARRSALQASRASCDEAIIPPSILGEADRLLGKPDAAAAWFAMAIERDGKSIQTIAGLADCTRDAHGMQQVIASTGEGDYWFWLAHLRLVQWHVDDGGDPAAAIARVNRLRRLDGDLGGPQFQRLFAVAVGD
jgi:hypothetical protein